MSSRFLLKRVAMGAAKLTFGVGVFFGTLGAWSVAQPIILDRLPLPGENVSGPCSVWMVGSSSIHLWSSMQQDMGGWRTSNRGVNGASLHSVIARLGRSDVTPPPAAIVFYMGENDLAAGQPAGEVIPAMLTVVRETHRRVPGTRLFVVGMKPSPHRWSNRPDQLLVDRAMTRAAAAGAPFTFLPVSDALLVNGHPGPYYRDDGVHLNADGYTRWGGAIRTAFDNDMPMNRRQRCTGARGHAGTGMPA